MLVWSGISCGSAVKEGAPDNGTFGYDSAIDVGGYAAVADVGI